VPAAAYGDEQSVLPGKVDGGDDVAGVGAARDQRWMAVDHPVVDLAGLVVASIARLDQFAAESAGEIRDGRRVDAWSNC
jgi:3D (Asp-Asp-Asp) domain-containing protein